MKKNEYDFTKPTRQSYVAILMILYKTFTLIFRQLLPILVVVLIGGSEKKTGRILFGLIAVSVISMLYSVINFFMTYFYIDKEELVIQSGVFTRKKITIPFEKIQTINFEQNIVHRFFSVLRLKVDTAGSDKSEFEFHALDAQKATALRDFILSTRSLAHSVNYVDSDEINLPTNQYKSVMTLSVADLIKVGATENHLKSGGVILLFGFWIYQNLNEAGVDVEDYSDEIPEFEFNVTLSFILIGIFLSASFLISMVRTIVKYYDLNMLRSTNGFKVVSGLLTKREVSAFDHKIQQIGWSDNLLKKMIGFKNLYLKQASSVELKSAQTTKIPGCTQEHINAVVNSLYGQGDLFSIDMHPVSKKYFFRIFVFTIPLAMIVSLGFILIQNYASIGWIVLISCYLIATRYLSWTKKKYGFNEELIRIEGGIFGDKAELLPIFKIQALELSDSPYQRNNGLTSVIIHTASGQVTIPYIPIENALSMLNLFIYKTEKDTRKWM